MGLSPLHEGLVFCWFSVGFRLVFSGFLVPERQTPKRLLFGFWGPCSILDEASFVGQQRKRTTKPREPKEEHPKTGKQILKRSRKKPKVKEQIEVHTNALPWIHTQTYDMNTHTPSPTKRRTLQNLQRRKPILRPEAGNKKSHSHTNFPKKAQRASCIEDSILQIHQINNKRQ